MLVAGVVVVLMSGAPAIPHSPLRSVLTFRPLSLPGQRAKGISCFVLGPSGHCVRLRASGLYGPLGLGLRF